MAQGLRQAVTWECEADAAGVVRVGVLSGVMEAEDRLRRAQGREAVHLHHVGRLIVLQVVVALQIGNGSMACETDALQAPRERKVSCKAAGM